MPMILRYHYIWKLRAPITCNCQKQFSRPLKMTVYKQTTPILSVHKSDTLLAGLVIPHLFLSNTEATLQNMPSSAWAALWRHYTVTHLQ